MIQDVCEGASRPSIASGLSSVAELICFVIYRILIVYRVIDRKLVYLQWVVRLEVADELG